MACKTYCLFGGNDYISNYDIFIYRRGFNNKNNHINYIECCDIVITINMKRNKLERWVDRYNHTLELVRTVTGILVLTLQLLVLYKLFN